MLCLSSANDFIENELTDEDYESLGIEDAAVVKEIQSLVEALANPPPPPPAKTYHRHLAPQLIEAVKEGDIPEMERLLKMVRRQLTVRRAAKFSIATPPAKTRVLLPAVVHANILSAGGGRAPAQIIRCQPVTKTPCAGRRCAGLQ